MEAAKEYDLTTRTGTLNGTNLVIEGTADVAVSGGMVKINS
jgi:type VI secretion system secreted protein VgrG